MDGVIWRKWGIKVFVTISFTYVCVKTEAFQTSYCWVHKAMSINTFAVKMSWKKAITFPVKRHIGPNIYKRFHFKARANIRSIICAEPLITYANAIFPPYIISVVTYKILQPKTWTSTSYLVAKKLNAKVLASNLETSSANSSNLTKIIDIKQSSLVKLCMFFSLYNFLLIAMVD